MAPDGGLPDAPRATRDLAPRAGVWRVRVRLADEPGVLASLTAHLADHGCNVLGLAVIPIGTAGTDGPGAVVDEIVLAAPGNVTPDEITAMVSSDGARCIGVVSASVAELVDGQTTALRDAAGVLSGAVSMADAIGRLLAAESIECVSASAAPDNERVVVSANGCRAHVAVDGSIVTVTRTWAPFTELELARVSALVELVASAPLPSGTSAAAGAGPRKRRQLSSLDVQFLNAETPTASTHIGSLTILDPTDRPGGPVTVGELRRLIGSRLHLVAPLRWRLHTVPLGLDLPYWLDSGAVDLTQHVRELSVAEPGTDEQLGALVSELAAQPLDRRRPLWQAYLINGLAQGRQALYTKVHHAVIDGVSGAEIMAVVLDLDRTPRRVPRAPSVVLPEPAPSAAEMFGRGLRNKIRAVSHSASTAPGLVRHAMNLPGAGAVPLAGLLAGVTGMPKPCTAPRTALNRRVSAHRSFGFTTLPLAEVKTVRKALGLTVNDVVMALCTTAIRRWLKEHDALPSRSLVAGIPVSVRTAEQIGTGGNRISFMVAPLPTEVDDPVERAQILRESLAASKRRVAGGPSGLLDDVTALLPQVLHGVVPRALLAATRFTAPPINVLVSNVPGPQLALYAAGARVVSNHPVSVISDVTGGLNITVMSYDGHLDIGLVACRRIVPDVWKLAGHLRDALDELLVAAETEPGSETGVRTEIPGHTRTEVSQSRLRAT